MMCGFGVKLQIVRILIFWFECFKKNNKLKKNNEINQLITILLCQGHQIPPHLKITFLHKAYIKLFILNNHNWLQNSITFASCVPIIILQSLRKLNLITTIYSDKWNKIKNNCVLSVFGSFFFSSMFGIGPPPAWTDIFSLFALCLMPFVEIFGGSHQPFWKPLWAAVTPSLISQIWQFTALKEAVIFIKTTDQTPGSSFAGV